jgi:hypothetical protein
MSQELINNGEQGFAIRTKINNNFTETYTNITTLSSNMAPSVVNNLNTNAILGRYSAGQGKCEEVSLGSGLAIAGGSLNYTISKTIKTFTATEGELTAASSAALSTRGTHNVLTFNDTTQNTAFFRLLVPDYTDFSNGVYVGIIWAATASVGTVGWDVAFERCTVDVLDLDTDNFGLPIATVPATVPGAAGVVTRSFITFTQAQLPSGTTSGDMLRLRVRRDVANDTAVGDALLLGVAIQRI